MNRDAVLAASANAVWEPPFATVQRLPEFTLVKYPSWFQQQTGAYRIDSERTGGDLIDAVLDAARELDSDAVWFQSISDTTRPADLEYTLIERGARLDERVGILALDLTAALPELDVPIDTATTTIRSLAHLRDFDIVSHEAFENDVLNDQDPAERLTRITQEEDRGTGGYFVTYINDRPAGAGGLTFYADAGVALLWGGSTATWARGRGAYRSNLAARLAFAKEHGLQFALVKGRVHTSGPILRRAGFTSFGEERVYRLAVPPRTRIE